jgi:hypothetical protein
MRSLVLWFLLSSGLRALLPVAVEAIKYLPVGAVSSCWLVDYHHVQARKLCLIEPKRLSDDALYSVAAARRAAILF